MSAVLIISIFLLAAISFAIYRTKRLSFKSVDEQDFFPPSSRGLFEDKSLGAAPGATPDTHAGLSARLLAKAEGGELSALDEARAAGDPKLYDGVLDALLRRDASAENVRAVAARVVGSSSLRGNPTLAGAMLTHWRLSPEVVTVADFLRVAALSDDAAVFREAVGEVVAAWERGRVPGMSADDLRLLFESEYWVLSPEALRSGAGFRLKQELAEVRRRLSAAPSAQSLPTRPGEVEAGDSLR